MPPTIRKVFTRRDFDPSAPSAAFAAEWSKPSNYAFTVLLLIGGDVVSRAMAQLVGGIVTPVAFSFGWVSYATSSLCKAVGENKLMPGADTPCCIINGKNGFVRGNDAWVLGRMMRDYEFWTHETVHHLTQSLIDKRWEFELEMEKKEHEAEGRTDPTRAIPRPRQAGLVVSFWEPSKTREAGRPAWDLLYWSGLVVCVIQLGIAAIPCGIHGDWSVLLVTTAAILLCFATGSLTQWRVEKWACRRLDSRSKKPFVLTRGNGAQHAIAILANGHGLDLEDLATGFANLDPPSITVFARLAMVSFGVLWVALLITSSAIAEQAWFLVAVGGVGMLQNIFVAGWRRRPEALGVPLDFVDVVGDVKVMKTLMEVERKYEKLGLSLLPTFFPGNLREEEKKEWEEIAKVWKEKR